MTTDKTPATLAVDVLAVLDYERQMIPLSTEDFGPQREQDVRDLRAARTAVAELIEALEPAVSEEGMDQPELDRLRAALARVKGESA